jgi:dipeptidyl aminopeptidase/acylaminoacyl peptidase
MLRATTVLCSLAIAVSAQQVPFTMQQVLSASFPTELTAAPAGAKVAWFSGSGGARNIMVAEPPAYQARKVTNYTQDDGQELSQLRWTPDASTIVYVRGQGANSVGQHPNPTLDVKGVEQSVWAVGLDGSAPRKIGEGTAPAVSPRGERIAFVRQGQVWWAPADGKTAAPQPFHTRGECADPVWSPDAVRLAFVSNRGDHALIGVYDTSAGTLLYLDPSTDFDSAPEWSPDGRRVAFIREPSSGMRPVREARRAGEPWSLRVASADTGAGRQVWRAQEGPGSVFRGIGARNQVLWSGAGTLIFPWEGDGWTHLYSLPAEGGKAALLTPGDFEVEEAALTADGREIVFSSNQGDIDRRHLWKVAVNGGAPFAITSGEGIEVAPAPIGDGKALAYFHSDAQRPLRAAIRVGKESRELDPGALPADFPVSHMVTPRQVIFSSADGMPIHGQLFLPPNQPAGRAPAVVFFHGGSRRQMLLGWHPMYYYSNAYALNQYLANAGYVVLSVNYRSGTGYGLNFREALNYGASGASEYNDVQGAGVYLRSRADVDPARIGAWGGSYGGFLTALALARASDLFKAGVDFHGVHNWATELGIPVTAPDYKVAFESSPMAFLDTWRSPVLLIQGDDDRDVQFNQTVMLAGALRRRKVEMEELVFPDEVHDFLLHRRWIEAYEATVRFLGQHLKP